jgi:hypothetical protein
MIKSFNDFINENDKFGWDMFSVEELIGHFMDDNDSTADNDDFESWQSFFKLKHKLSGKLPDWMEDDMISGLRKNGYKKIR